MINLTKFLQKKQKYIILNQQESSDSKPINTINKVLKLGAQLNREKETENNKLIHGTVQKEKTATKSLSRTPLQQRTIGLMGQSGIDGILPSYRDQGRDSVKNQKINICEKIKDNLTGIHLINKMELFFWASDNTLFAIRQVPEDWGIPR